MTNFLRKSFPYKKVIKFIISLFFPFSLFTTNYYVSGTGNDSNDGLSPFTAFRNPQTAANLTQPGDTVFLMNGIYKNPCWNCDVIYITSSGTPNAWIVYTNYPGHTPELRFNGWAGVSINNGASYIKINGLKIVGNNDSITLAYALSEKNNLNNPLTSGNGITVRWNANPPFSHHLVFSNNDVSKCGGGGIGTNRADYVTIENNFCYENGWYSPYGCSGISLYQNWNSDSSTGYKNFIRNNICFRNENQVPFFFYNNGCCITDGNGIIIDDFQNTQFNSTLGPYHGRTLVANNILIENGGSAIHTFFSDHVDIIYNTAYKNSRSAHPVGEIYATYSSDVNIYNNIVYALENEQVNKYDGNVNVNYAFNTYWNTVNIAVTGPGDTIADPLFTDTLNHDFRLLPGSHCINSASPLFLIPNDFENNPRPVGSGYDRGAYEFQLATQSPEIYSHEIIIYPNLSNNGIFFIKDVNLLKAEIFDSAGRKVKTISSISNGILNLSDISGGIYFLNLYSKNCVYRKLLVKN